MKSCFKMKINEFEISHHSRKLLCKSYFPTDSEQFPVVIFSHGFNGYIDDRKETELLLAENCIGAVAFSFCGGGLPDKSGFPTEKMTVFTETEDLEAVLEAVQKTERTDKNNIFLFGESMGGLVSALTAEKHKDEIKGLILLYPAFCVDNDWRRRYPKLEDIPETDELWGVKLGKCFAESIHNFYTFDEIGGFDKNILIFHGDSDGIVPLEYSIKASEIYKNSTLKVFKEEGHGFSPDGSKKVSQMTLDFVKKNM